MSLDHTKWECKCHVVFIPKYRRKALYGSVRKHLDSLFRELTRHKECEIGEGRLMVDHVHMLVSIPPKYSVSQVRGYSEPGSGQPRWHRRMQRCRNASARAGSTKKKPRHANGVI